MKKILFVGNGLLDTDNYPTPNRGASVQTWGLSKELARRGYEVFIIRRSDTDVTESVDNVNLVGVKLRGIRFTTPSFLFHLSRKIFSIRFSKKSLKCIRKINPSTLCLMDRFSGIFPASLDTPKIFIMHVAEALDLFKSYSISANPLNSILFYIKKAFETRVMQMSDKVVVLNRYIENYLKAYGFNNVVRIPNAIEPENFSNEGDGGFILYAGRFDWNKNVSSLLHAFAEISTDCSLYLVGEGPEEEKVKAQVRLRKLQNRVVVIPWLSRQKLIEIMSRCSFFVLPSRFEVFPVIIQEAMASGKAVVARANMGTLEIITHGYNGYLYSSQEKLEEYLELLLSNSSLRKKIGDNARKTVERKYSFKKIAESYEKLFESICRIGEK